MEKPSILHYIAGYASLTPDKLAVCELRKTLTYSEYFTAIRKAAAALRDAGVKAGHHTVIRCTQNIDFLVLFTALQYLRAIPVPVEKMTKPERICEIAGAVDADVVINNEPCGDWPYLEQKALLKAALDAEPLELPLPEESGRSMILFTTGTTGKSKGVVCLHRGDVAVAGNITEGTKMRSGNVEVIPMPLNHAFGMRRYSADIAAGGTVCIMDGMAFIGTLWKLMEKYSANSMAVSPASLSMIFRLSEDRIADYREQLDFIQIGSAPLPETDKQRLLSLLPDCRLYNFYGSSEAGCSCILNFNSPDNRPSSIGRVTVNSRLRFLDSDGNPVTEVSADKPALLAWGGPLVMEGYYKEPGLTAQTMPGGYVLTKDLGYLDETGNVILVGRADDIINYGGSKISPAEIEDAVCSCPGVQDAACSWLPDEIAGQVPVLLLVPAADYDEQALTGYLKQNLESYKLPHAVFFTEAIPKTFKGSVLRKDVHRLVLQLREAENR